MSIPTGLAQEDQASAPRCRCGQNSGERDTRDVYFIQGVTGGPVKIGVSADPRDRLASLQAASPVPLQIIGVVPGVGQPGERLLHERFAAHRSRGEWFHPAPELISYIGRQCDSVCHEKPRQPYVDHAKVVAVTPEEKAIRSVCAAVMRKLGKTTGGGWVVGGELTKTVARRNKEFIKPAVARLAGTGQIEYEKIVYRGNPGYRVRLATAPPS